MTATHREDAFRSAMERLPVAVIVVDSQKRLQPYNQRAAVLFENEALRGDLLATRPGHPLASLVAAILGGDESDEHVITFPSGTRYRIEPSRRSEKGRDRWLVLLVSRGTDAPVCDFDFTPRESEVAALLAGGQSTDEICEAMSIRRDTLKSHMKNLFEKTGTRNRVELVSRLLRRS